MSIFNVSNIESLYVGNTKIRAAYVGDTNIYISEHKFVPKTWNITIDGRYVWSDGTDLYYSNGSSQYILNRSTGLWEQNTANWSITIDGRYVWNDGNDTYYSTASSSTASHYVFDKTNNDWVTKAWGNQAGLTRFQGNQVWRVGNTIYANNAANCCSEYDRTNDTWVAKTWTGLRNFQMRGENVWYDKNGDAYIQATGGSTYKLDISNDTWSSKTWSGSNPSSIAGQYYWNDIDGTPYVSRDASTQYVYDTANDTWSTKTWPDGNVPTNGIYIFRDGNTIYYSDGTLSYELV